MKKHLLNIVLASLCVLSPSLSWAELEEKTSYRTYPVRHHSGQPVMLAIMEQTPIGGSVTKSKNPNYKAVGLTTSSSSYSFKMKVKPVTNKCSIASHKIVYQAEILTPQLMTTDPLAKKSFTKIADDIMSHEKVHHNIGLTSAKKMDAALGRLGEFSSCDELKVKVKEVEQGFTTEATKLNNQLDQNPMKINVTMNSSHDKVVSSKVVDRNQSNEASIRRQLEDENQELDESVKQDRLRQERAQTHKPSGGSSLWWIWAILWAFIAGLIWGVRRWLKSWKDNGHF